MNPIFVRRRDVEKIIALSYSTFNRFEKEGKFPKRLKLGEFRVVWLYSDIVEWSKQFRAESS